MTEIWALTATEMAAKVKAGAVTARALAESTLARIDAANPPLNAVVQRLDDEALAAADAVDAALARGDDPGPLAGVPVTIKVNVDQAGLATTNGLRGQAGLIATADNPVVANFRKAGAVIVGRTNTPAFSLRWFTRNSLHGHTRNPRDPRLTPGGSSGGAAAAVAAGMAPIAHGNDIAGSVRYPAYACGIHGLRPSFGRVPGFNATAGDRHIGAQLMAEQGPLARSIGDLRLALAAMAARDIRDPWWMPVPLEGAAYPRRVALCIAPDGLDVAPEIAAALRAAAERLAAAGWTVEEVATPPLREAMAMQLRLWMGDFRRTAGVVGGRGRPGRHFRLRPALPDQPRDRARRPARHAPDPRPPGPAVAGVLRPFSAAALPGLGRAALLRPARRRLRGRFRRGRRGADADDRHAVHGPARPHRHHRQRRHGSGRRPARRRPVPRGYSAGGGRRDRADRCHHRLTRAAARPVRH